MVNIFKMKKRVILQLVITVVTVSINTIVHDVSLDIKINL